MALLKVNERGFPKRWLFGWHSICYHSCFASINRAHGNLKPHRLHLFAHFREICEYLQKAMHYVQRYGRVLKVKKLISRRGGHRLPFFRVHLGVIKRESQCHKNTRDQEKEVTAEGAEDAPGRRWHLSES